MKKKLLLFLILVSLCLTGCIFKKEEVFNKNDKLVKVDKNILGKSFVRTYRVYHIADSLREKYVYITIRGFNQEDIDTVLVEKSLFSSLEVDKDYEFTFKIINEDIDESIQAIFQNSEIVSVQETDKVGEEQINEDMYGH